MTVKMIREKAKKLGVKNITRFNKEKLILQGLPVGPARGRSAPYLPQFSLIRVLAADKAPAE